MRFDAPPPPQYDEDDFHYMRGLGCYVGLGPELLVNGDFSGGATGWTVIGNDGTHIITFSGGTMRFQSDTTSPQLLLVPTTSVTLVTGKSYQLTVVTSSYTSGSIKSDAMTGTPAIGTILGSKTFTFIALPSGFGLTRNSVNVDLTIDSISLKRVL